MKIAVISDIHGNLYALMRVIEDIEDNRVDSIICLGDLVGYGPHPNECVALIRRKNILCLRGNYDTSVVENQYSYIRKTETNNFCLPWAVNELRAENKYYLSQLPTSLSLEFNDKKIKFVHGSPNAINEYLLEDGENTLNIMKNLKEDALVCAHTHLPSYKNFDNKKFINVGSVGKPKIGIPKSTYAIIEINSDEDIKVTIQQVPYEVKGIVKDMKMLGFPSTLINSFETGNE